MKSFFKHGCIATQLMFIAMLACPLAMAAPNGDGIRYQKDVKVTTPKKMPAQRLFVARCRIDRNGNGEFPNAVAIAPFALAKGTRTLVTLISKQGATQVDGLTTSAAIAKGAEFIVVPLITQAESCSVLIIR